MVQAEQWHAIALHRRGDHRRERDRHPYDQSRWSVGAELIKQRRNLIRLVITDTENQLMTVRCEWILRIVNNEAANPLRRAALAVDQLEDACQILEDPREARARMVRHSGEHSPTVSPEVGRKTVSLDNN